MEDSALRRLLDDLAVGRRSVDEVAAHLQQHGLSEVGDFARLDLGRQRRKGVPEIVLAAGKSADQVVAIVRAFLAHSEAVFCSKTSAEQYDAVVEAAVGEAEFDPRSGVLVVRRRGASRPDTSGLVGVLAAGTADVSVAEEAAAVCREMGVGVATAYDVGVAGVHRLSGPLGDMAERGAAALVVAAGMEGALPSVVSGLVAVPVIGLPTSTGYGMGGEGEAALLAMLQSCSPGLVVVNIDNGVGAGVTAALIARGAARGGKVE
jgi:NCAIR mutase (PurE)-related protein